MAVRAADGRTEKEPCKGLVGFGGTCDVEDVRAWQASLQSWRAFLTARAGELLPSGAPRVPTISGTPQQIGDDRFLAQPLSPAQMVIYRSALQSWAGWPAFSQTEAGVLVSRWLQWDARAEALANRYTPPVSFGRLRDRVDEIVTVAADADRGIGPQISSLLGGPAEPGAAGEPPNWCQRNPWTCAGVVASVLGFVGAVAWSQSSNGKRRR